MHATLSGDAVRAGERARERFYDSSGYGHPVDGGALELAPVEAAHLLYRGDLEAVDGPDGTAMDFRAFLESAAVSEIAFLVYKDLRDRGFYLSPARAGWSDASAARAAVDDPAVDFLVYPRGSGPWDDEVAYRVGVVSEREEVPAGDLGNLVLAVVDEESALTYLATEHREVSGTSGADLPRNVSGELLSDRLLLWDPPAAIYDRGFYGQPLDDRDGDVIQLSLLEAAFLAREGVLDVGGGADAVVDRGREVEGERFDRRLRVYEALRERGLVPKTGYKFGADFRTYADVESVEDLGHSELLIRVLDGEHTFSPRDLALDVRLAHGVRKEMVFALVDDEDTGDAGSDGEGIEWLSVTRLTP